MPPVLDAFVRQLGPATLLDIALVAVFIYWLFSLIRGTRAVTLVIGVSVLLGIYALARAAGLQLVPRLLETGAVVGLFALVVIFQPELRRALDRIGRAGSFGWLVAPSGSDGVEAVATEIARAAGRISADGHGALIVIERETGLEEVAESGVMLHADLSVDLIRTIFTPRTALHDGAIIVRGRKIVAAAALLPLTETLVASERIGTRHRAALGITEQTDAVVVVVSEERGAMSLVERARIVRVPGEAQLATALRELLEPRRGRRSPFGGGGPGAGAGSGRRLVPLGRDEPTAQPEPEPAPAEDSAAAVQAASQS